MVAGMRHLHVVICDGYVKWEYITESGEVDAGGTQPLFPEGTLIPWEEAIEGVRMRYPGVVMRVDDHRTHVNQ